MTIEIQIDWLAVLIVGGGLLGLNILLWILLNRAPSPAPTGGMLTTHAGKQVQLTAAQAVAIHGGHS